jgi:hypothetical protein
MPHPLRWYQPDVIYEATTRTIQERFLLRPGRACRALILGVIGRALLLYPSVKLYAFVFLSNHYHLLASASDGEELALFFGFVNGNIAREMGRLHGWSGPLWARRVRPIPILDPDALVSRLRYLLSNGVKEGLVASPREWPGATSVHGLLGNMMLEGTWVDRDALRRARAKDPNVSVEQFSTTVEVPLSPLPQWAGLEREELRGKYEALVHEVEAEGARTGLSFMGPQAVMMEDPHASPQAPERRRAPICHTTSPALRRAFRDAYRAFVGAYREAARLVRTTAESFSAKYPDGSFPRPRVFRRPAAPFIQELSSALDRPRPHLGWGISS